MKGCQCVPYTVCDYPSIILDTRHFVYAEMGQTSVKENCSSQYDYLPRYLSLGEQCHLLDTV